MNNYSLRVGVLGATGYAGAEVVRRLARHSRARLGFATSESDAGALLSEVVLDAPDLRLCGLDDAPLGACDVVVSCLPHGTSAAWVARVRAAGRRAIDLSSDLRVPRADGAGPVADAAYGLTEVHRAAIGGAAVVANPGCYPTGALLALAPLVRRGWLRSAPVVIDAASGVTGAGRAAKRELLFGEVAEDFRAYGVGNVHGHLEEMRHQLGMMGGGRPPELVFTPHLLPIRRGILETIYVPVTPEALAGELLAPWHEDYAGEAFVRVFGERMPSIADVAGTNRLALGVTPVAGVSEPMLIVVAALDNLVKGAAGQAIQNLNLMFGIPEMEGLAA